ncbi:ribonuclease III [Lysobacter sp. HDW10]|nr:ribonuclease III [Lysobacter sp. HDW10]
MHRMQQIDLIGHTFKDANLLTRALKHRSAGAEHNERLEFLGDSIVNFLVAEALFKKWPAADEGALTRMRADLVRESSLAAIARTLSLGDRLLMGPGEIRSGGFRRESILSDALEAIIGAIYLDAGIETCKQVVLPWFDPRIAALDPKGDIGKDAKTLLQEWLQARQRSLPVYTLMSETGEEHARTFFVRCQLDDGLFGEDSGKSRRQAETRAAERVLSQLIKS